MKRSGKLNSRADNETNNIKDSIQSLLRQIVTLRDGGCILRDLSDTMDIPECNGRKNNGELVLQADHLVTRANSATYSDTRLVVCVCKGHHGWKKWNEERYNAIVRTILSPERVKLWGRAHAARYQPHRKYTYDWRMDEAALKQELHQMERSGSYPPLTSTAGIIY